jgi:hypothetical protein
MAATLDYYYTKFMKAEARPLVTGDDLLQRGLNPGPRFREILDQIREKQAEGAFSDRRGALDYLERLL